MYLWKGYDPFGRYDHLVASDVRAEWLEYWSGTDFTIVSFEPVDEPDPASSGDELPNRPPEDPDLVLRRAPG